MNNAQTGLEKAVERENVQVPKSINDFNKEQDEKKKLEESSKPVVEKKAFITPSGKNKCVNKGCNKEFDPLENTETSCNYHPGAPVKPYNSRCSTI